MQPFYTVITTPSGRFTVRFVEPPEWAIWEIAQNYDDPGEAEQEFKATHERFRACKPLPKVAFDRRILQHKQDMEKLKSWIKV